jgi:hypothetical protein
VYLLLTFDNLALANHLIVRIRELREVIELPLTNPELFIRVGIKVSGDNVMLHMDVSSMN